MAEPIDNPFLAAVRRHFGDVLDEEGFALVQESYDRDSFGNAVVTYHSARLAIRFDSDKGIVFMELGAKRALFELGQLVAFLEHGSPHFRSSAGREGDLCGSTEAQVAALRRNGDHHRRQLLEPALFTKRKHELKRFIATGHTFPSGQQS